MQNAKQEGPKVQTQRHVQRIQGLTYETPPAMAMSKTLSLQLPCPRHLPLPFYRQ